MRGITRLLRAARRRVACLAMIMIVSRDDPTSAKPGVSFVWARVCGFCSRSASSPRNPRTRLHSIDSAPSKLMQNPMIQDEETKLALIYGFLAAFLPLAVVTVSLRLYARWRFTHVGKDDILVVVGLVRAGNPPVCLALALKS